MRIHPSRSIRALLLVLPLAYISTTYAYHPTKLEHSDVVMPMNHHDHPYEHPQYSSRPYPPPEFREVPWPVIGREGYVIYLADHGRRHFEDLPPERQEEIRKRREAFRALPKEEQERIHKARERFRQMPPEKREALKERWRKMSPEERERFFKEKQNHFPPKR